MHSKILIPTLFIFGLLLTSCGGGKSKNPHRISAWEQEVENIMQRASFVDTTGQEVYVSDFHGKVLLVDFWETWCGPCLAVFPAMDSLRQEYPEDFAVLTVNLQIADNPADVKEFIEQYGYDFTFSLDVNNVSDEVITMGIPFKVFFDPDGHLIKAEVGTSGTERDYEKTKVIIEDNKKS